MRKVAIVALVAAVVGLLVALAYREDERRIGPRYPVPGSSATR